MLRMCMALVAAHVLAMGAEPYSWLPFERRLELTRDGFQVLCHGSHDACDVGVRFDSLERVDEFQVSYAVVAGRAYEPAIAGQMLQRWSDGTWRDVPASLTVDYGDAGAAAPVQRSGFARWRYRFSPVETTRLRVLLTQPRNSDAWHRAYAVNQIDARLSGSRFDGPGVRIVGSLPDVPRWLDAGANLAVPAAGARVSTGLPATVRWPRRLMISRVEWAPAQTVSVEWWDGASWRPVEQTAPADANGISFLPVSTTAVRVRGGRAVSAVRAYLDSGAADYAREVQQSRFDVLGHRFRGFERPDLNAMRSLLPPLDFAQIAIGRPADVEETHVTWNGVFFMVEEAGGQDWNHGAQNRGPRGVRHDRWFGLAAGDLPELPGADWTSVSASYLDGWLPASVTTWQKDGIEYRQTLYVTAPGDPIYGTVAEVRATNTGRQRRETRVALAMGRRRNAQAMGPERDPLAFWPEITGYRLADGGRVVTAANGDVVAFADAPGEWAGSDRENQLRYAFALGASESRTLRFLIPSVTQPVKAHDLPADYDWRASLARFRDFWNRTLGDGMELEVPDAELNRIYRNLLTQCLIITLDGDDQVKYGSYSYESYFGIEEGWPAIALAQYGLHRPAQQILSAMLSPRLMDKSNYHHQYRNGLEPWYAITAYRMSRDRRWRLRRSGPSA